MKIRTVSIVGLGALGIMFADHLTKKITKAAVRIVADRNRIQRYIGGGVYCNGKLCDFNYVPKEKAMEPADLIIFAVKYNQLNQAIEVAKNQIGENTIILSALNGISSEEMIGEVHGMDKILYCVAQGMDAVKKENSLTYVNMGKLCFGEKNNEVWSDKVKAVAEFFDSTNFPYEVVVDMEKRYWGKFMLNTGVNQTTAVFRAPYGVIQVPGKPREVMIEAMKEIMELSQKEGVNLTAEDLQYWLRVVDALSPEGKTSMLQDIEARRPSEVELFSGTAIKLGRKHNVPTPVNEMLYAKIQELERTLK
jgi:2-dehydropantoate 2-reductase